MFTEYLSWYANKRLRTSGRPVAQTISAQDASHVSTCIGDRVNLVKLLDALYARLTPGSVRNIATTLRGVQGQGSSTPNGKWLGPYPTGAEGMAVAQSAARQRRRDQPWTVEVCANCAHLPT